MNALFSTADAARRLQGLALDRLGFAPRTTPSRHVAKTRAVARLLSSGVQVYLLEWYRPQPGDEALGLEHYAERAIRISLDAIRTETGEARAVLAGHSLGGTFAAVFASLHPH